MKTVKAHREPLVRIVKRDGIALWKNWLIRLAAVVVALLLSGLFIYAVRGLDINTSYTIYNLLTEQKMQGIAVVYVGEDLDVLLELCDRILVLCAGQVNGIVDARTTTKEEVGLLMTHLRKEETV